MTRIKIDNEWFDADAIPELTKEEMQDIIGHVERYDEYKERIVNDVMGLDLRQDRSIKESGLEHNPRFKHFGNGAEFDGGGALC